MLVHETTPLDTANEEAVACRQGPVQKHGTSIESDAVSPNHIAVLEPQHVVWLAVNFETNLEHSVEDEIDLVHFIQLLVQNDSGLLPSRLQTPQHVDHEVSVSLMVPGVERGLMRIILFRKNESPSIDSQEVFEHKLLVHHLPDLFWQLVEYVFVLLLQESHILVHAPFVFEERLNALL